MISINSIQLTVQDKKEGDLADYIAMSYDGRDCYSY